MWPLRRLPSAAAISAIPSCRDFVRRVGELVVVWLGVASFDDVDAGVLAGSGERDVALLE